MRKVVYSIFGLPKRYSANWVINITSLSDIVSVSMNIIDESLLKTD
jgi:hypothetical protein